MKALKFTLLLASCTFLSTTFAQTLKPKQVPLANWNDDQGLSSYTYYEDPKTGDYIPHGKFSYKLAQGTYYKEDAIGSLKKGKRDGIWTYKVTRLDDLAFDVNWTGTIQLSFGYKEGNPNGLWTYSNIQKYRTKSRGAWLPYEFQFAPNETLSVMFTDGHPSGIYSYANNSFSNKVKTTGQFNAKGYIHGTWLISSSGEQSEFVFNNGILVKKVVRAMPSGKVSDSYIASADELKLHAAFLAKTLTKEDILKNRIKIDTIDSDDYITCDERKTLFNKYFNWDNIGGDNLFDANRGEYLGGKAIDFELIELVSLADNQYFKELEDKFRNSNDSKTRDTLELKKAFDGFYKENRLSLNDEDYQKSLAIQAELKQIVVDRDEKEINYWMLRNFPILDVRGFNNSAEEFVLYFKTYNTLVNESKYNDVVYKIDSAYFERIKKAWTDGVLKKYTDLSRAEKINKENTDWMKDFDSMELSEQAGFLKSAFMKMYTEYYLINFEQLKAENKIYELNRFVDKLKFTQSAYYRIYYRDAKDYDNKLILEKLSSAKSNEEFFTLLYEFRTIIKDSEPFNYL
jgi:hypothetical protein